MSGTYRPDAEARSEGRITRACACSFFPEQDNGLVFALGNVPGTAITMKFIHKISVSTAVPLILHSQRLSASARVIFFAMAVLISPQLHAAPLFGPGPALSAGAWPDHSAELCAVAEQTRLYLEQGEAYDPAAIHGGKLAAIATPLARIKETLAFVCQVVEEDRQAGRPSRLGDADFLEQAFEWVHWSPDRDKAASLAAEKPLLQNLPADQILLTKYYIRIAEGSPASTPETPHALHGLPFDEADLELDEADARADMLTRYRYGKQEVLTGVLEQQRLAPALIWLSRVDLEGALLQGTAVLLEGAERRYFNVHRNNGIAYDRLLRPEQQQRYWYFKEVPGVLGYGKDAENKIPVHPRVTVAGDIFQLGLGRLILLQTTETGRTTYRLTVMADTGGAFADNLYQLDWLSGYYRDWKDYHQHNRHIGDYAHAWLLLKR